MLVRALSAVLKSSAPARSIQTPSLSAVTQNLHHLRPCFHLLHCLDQQWKMCNWTEISMGSKINKSGHRKINICFLILVITELKIHLNEGIFNMLHSMTRISLIFYGILQPQSAELTFLSDYSFCSNTDFMYALWIRQSVSAGTQNTNPKKITTHYRHADCILNFKI